MWRRLTLLILAGCAALAGAQSAAAGLPDGLYAAVTTAKGVIVIRLRPDAAPMAVASFVGLAEGTITNRALDAGQPFFDHSTFHRVVPGHVIQTGIPDSTRAKAPGYMFPNEIDARLSHDHAGAVGMANGGPGTNAAQWYITLGNRSYLDGDYTVFGAVVRGMDVVMRIRQGDALDTVRILRVGRAAAAYHPTTASFEAMVAAAKKRVAEEAVRKQAAETAWIRKNYPQARGAAGGVLTETLAAAPADAPAAGGTLRVRYSGRVLRYAGAWTHYSGPVIRATAFASGPGGVPGFHEQPEVFDYTVGKSKLNPGLDAVLARLRPGDRRIVVVPAALGYGKGGLYPVIDGRGPQRGYAARPAYARAGSGAPSPKPALRFVIGPNSLLVYDLEVVN